MENPKYTLIDTIQSLSRARQLEDIMKIVGEATRFFTGADGATFVLRDGDFCHYADENAIGPLWKGKKFPLETCISGWAMLNKKPAIIPDIFEDPRIPIAAYKPTFVKSLAMVPMRQDSPIGAVGNYWARPHTATPEQVELLQAVADTAAVALENVQLYGQLQQRIEDLNASGRAKDEFLMVVSHELRTPLNSIQGWSQLLSDGSLSPSESMQALDTIIRNVGFQTKIIDDLMDASSIVLGSFSMRKKPVALDLIVEAAVQAARPVATRRNLILEFQASAENLIVGADPARLQQACANLIDNAMKFTPPGGRIVVSTSKAGPSAQIDVRDSGEGIPAEFLPRLFDRFTQADYSLTRRHGGLGLGLAIVKHITESLGGSVTASSAGADKGAVFTIQVPLSKENY